MNRGRGDIVDDVATCVMADTLFRPYQFSFHLLFSVFVERVPIGGDPEWEVEYLTEDKGGGWFRLAMGDVFSDQTWEREVKAEEFIDACWRAIDNLSPFDDRRQRETREKFREIVTTFLNDLSEH